MTIETIELKMKSMNADAFHRLGDHFLYFDGGEEFESINPVGQAEGKQKPRRGTPDTRIKRQNGKFIFIQYTTQENTPKKIDFYKKLVLDLEACFDAKKTKIPARDIDLIVLCFNSNLDEATEEKLAKLTKAHDVPLKLVNLSTMAHGIYRSYHYLAKDYLGIEIGTLQLLPLEKFVEEYEKGGMATPLSNPFFFRQEEVARLKKILDDHTITVVKGPAGVGKSKLAVEVTRQFSKEHTDYRCFCLTNKDLSVINDLRSHFSQASNVLIFIDDVNKNIRVLKELLTWYAESTVQLKVLVTVREYVYKEIYPFIERYSNATLNLGDLSDDQLANIISHAPFDLTDAWYIKKIIGLAKGNARLGIMAAIASRGQPITVLDKVTWIYEKYYDRVSGDHHLLKDTRYLKVLGLLSFFRTLDRDDTEGTAKILDAFHLDDKDFWAKVYQLEEFEIVQVFSDKSTVKFTDQILESYLFYKVFIADQLLSFQVIMDQFYPAYSHRIKFVVTEGKATFGKSDFEDKLLPYIKDKYNMLLPLGSLMFDFFQAFYSYLPDETLAYVQQYIQAMAPASDLILLNKVMNKNSNQKAFAFDGDKILDNYTQDTFFNLVAEFLKDHSDDFELALGLLFDYIERKQEVSEKLIELVTSNFYFSIEDERGGFTRELELSMELAARVKTGRPVFKYIFLKLTPHFLKTNYFYRKNFKGASSSGTSNELLATVKMIRGIYWQTFNDIFCDYHLLSLYTLEYIKNGLTQNSEPGLREFDWVNLESIFDKHFDTAIFFDAYVINKMIDELSGNKGKPGMFKRYIELANTEKYQWFKALDFDLLRRRNGDKRENETWQDYNERIIAAKAKEILSTFNYQNASEYLPVFDVIGDCATHQIWPFFREMNCAQILLNRLIKDDEQLFISLFSVLIGKPYFYLIVRYEVLFKAIMDKGGHLLEIVESIILSRQFINDQYVRIGFFNALDGAHITPERCNNYQKILTALEGNYYLNFTNIKSYVLLDHGFLRDVLPKLLAQGASKTLTFRLEEDFIEKNYIHFQEIATAKQLYLYLHEQIDRYDYEGSELLFILNLDPDFLTELMDAVTGDLRGGRHDHHPLTALWKIADPNAAIAEIFDRMITSPQFLFRGENVLDELMETRGDNTHDGKKLAFFEYYIQANPNNLEKLNVCFKLVRHFLYNQFGRLFKLFLSLHEDVSLFKKIRWTAQGTIIRSGDSIAGELDERIWQEIKTLIQELRPQGKFLQHKLFVNQQIDYCRKSANSERKWDFMRNR